MLMTAWSGDDKQWEPGLIAFSRGYRANVLAPVLEEPKRSIAESVCKNSVADEDARL